MVSGCTVLRYLPVYQHKMSAMTQWDETATCQWLTRLGLGQYGQQFSNHKVRGDVLPLLDHEALTEIGVVSIGHRIRILKAIGSNWKEVDSKFLLQKVSVIEAQIQKVTEKCEKLRTDMMPVFRMVKENEPLPSLQKNASSTSITTIGDQPMPDIMSASQPNLPLQRAHSISLASPGIGKSKRYSAIPAFSSAKSPNQGHPQLPFGRAPSIEDPRQLRKTGGVTLLTEELSQRAPNSKVSMSTAYEPYKSFRVGMDDPCHRVLPVVMRHNGIIADSHEYRLVVQYGDHERTVADHEKPLHVYKELQDAGKRPVFMLRHAVTGVGQSASSTPGGVL